MNTNTALLVLGALFVTNIAFVVAVVVWASPAQRPLLLALLTVGFVTDIALGAFLLWRARNR